MFDTYKESVASTIWIGNDSSFKVVGIDSINYLLSSCFGKLPF